MKILITDEGPLWNDNAPALEQFKDNVIVISYYAEKPTVHTKQYTYIDIKVTDASEQDEYKGLKSNKFSSLCEHLDEIKTAIGENETVLILADNRISTLFPYKLYQIATYNEKMPGCGKKMNLWTILPATNDPENNIYEELVGDLSCTRSVLIMDSTVNQNNGNINLNERINLMLSEVYEKISGFRDMLGRIYFYDFKEDRYIDTNQVVDIGDWRYSLPGAGSLSISRREALMRQIHGLIIPRIDGKELCEVLKDARYRLAKANGIEFEPEYCEHVGACGGSCKVCDDELRYINDEMAKIPSNERVYPELYIDDKFVNKKYFVR